MTVGVQSSTQGAWVYSYDAPSVRAGLTFTNQMVSPDGRFVGVAGAGFGKHHYSGAARVGVTACEATEWLSASSITCSAGGGSGGRSALR